MARYIDADKLKEYIGDYAVNNYESVTAEQLDRMQEIVDSMETVDALPVVRCKVCKHSYALKCGYLVCQCCDINDDVVPAEWFCPYGERKGNGI